MAKKDELNFETDNKMASSEKLKALQAAMEKIEKSFGKGSIMKMGDDSVEQVEAVSYTHLLMSDTCLAMASNFAFLSFASFLRFQATLPHLGEQ